MKNPLIILTVVALLSAFLFTGCEEASTIDLSGILKIVPGYEDWNEGDDYFNAQFYTGIDVSDWHSAEQNTPHFVQVADADDEDNEDIFLMATMGYGSSHIWWRIYGTDPESSIYNGFAAGDTVDVSIDVWIPDLSVVFPDANSEDDPLDPDDIVQDAWFILQIKGTPAGLDAGNYDSADQVVKYLADEDNSGGLEQGTEGGTWETLSMTGVTVDDNGVVDIRVTMGSQFPEKAWVAYYDNIRVVKQ